MVVNSRYQGRNSKPRYTLIILTDLPSLRKDREMGMSQAGGDVRAATCAEGKNCHNNVTSWRDHIVIARRGRAEVFCLENYIAYIHSAETIIKAKLSLQRAPKFLHGTIFT